MANPYRSMSLPELHRLKKEMIARCREMKRQKNKSSVIKLKNDIGKIKDAIVHSARKQSNEMPREISPERIKVIEIKQQQHTESVSKYGFFITSHALKRYRLRFDPSTTLDALYEKMAATDLRKYMGILGNGQFPVQDNCVAVIQNKKILTFKDPNKSGLEDL